MIEESKFSARRIPYDRRRTERPCIIAEASVRIELRQQFCPAGVEHAVKVIGGLQRIFLIYPHLVSCVWGTAARRRSVGRIIRKKCGLQKSEEEKGRDNPHRGQCITCAQEGKNDFDTMGNGCYVHCQSYDSRR